MGQFKQQVIVAANTAGLVIDPTQIIVSLSPTFDVLLKTVAWTKLLSVDAVRRHLSSMSPRASFCHEMNFYISNGPLDQSLISRLTPPPRNNNNNYNIHASPSLPTLSPSSKDNNSLRPNLSLKKSRSDLVESVPPLPPRGATNVQQPMVAVNGHGNGNGTIDQSRQSFRQAFNSFRLPPASPDRPLVDLPAPPPSNNRPPMSPTLTYQPPTHNSFGPTSPGRLVYRERSPTSPNPRPPPSSELVAPDESFNNDNGNGNGNDNNSTSYNVLDTKLLGQMVNAIPQINGSTERSLHRTRRSSSFTFSNSSGKYSFDNMAVTGILQSTTSTSTSRPSMSAAPHEFTPTFSSFKRQSLLEPIIHQGELYKKNRNLVGWKRRYFILTSKKLLYCASQNDMPTRELLLSDHIVSVLSDNTSKYSTFALISNNGSVQYVFGADDEDTRREWITALNIASHSLNITLDLVGVDLISIPSNRQSVKEFDYWRQIPSNIRVNDTSVDILLFRSKMMRLFKMTSKWTFTSDHRLPAELTRVASPPTSPEMVQSVATSRTPSITPSNPRVQLVSVTVAQNKSDLSMIKKAVKLAIHHNGLVIKMVVDVDTTVGELLGVRPDLFEGNPKKYGLVILGSLEHIFNHSIILADLVYVQRCLRYRKTVRFSTVDASLGSRLFSPNVMREHEWNTFLSAMNSFDEQENVKAHVIRAKRILPSGVVHTKLTITVIGVSNIVPLLRQSIPGAVGLKAPIYVEILVYYGDTLLAKGRTSSQVGGEWNEKLYFNNTMVDLPKECVFLTGIYAKPGSSDSILLAQYPLVFMSYDNKKVLFSEIDLPLTPYPEFPIGTNNVISPIQPSSGDIKLIETLLTTHRAYLKESDKSILWKFRFYCKSNYHNILPSLLQAMMPLTEYQKRYEVYELLSGWPLLHPDFGLELLSGDFIDSKVREKGVESINQWDDTHLSLYLPQLVQNEMVADKNDKHSIFISIRYKLMMEAMVYGLGLSQSQNSLIGQSILQQFLMIQILKQINLDIIKEPDKQQKILETRLASLPKKFTLPTHPLQEFNTFIVEECKVKDSNAAPLWLVFSSMCPGADDTKIIFKKDDCRPDELVLQLFSVMDIILKENGMDCNFTIFKCISVGAGLGIIEVVPKSITLADFVREQFTIEEWLKKRNPDNKDYIDIFLKSSAAYSVATYLLGIYDRHNDNLMVSDTGHLFRKYSK
eukprot:gene2477-2818_t